MKMQSHRTNLSLMLRKQTTDDVWYKTRDKERQIMTKHQRSSSASCIDKSLVYHTVQTIGCSRRLSVILRLLWLDHKWLKETSGVQLSENIHAARSWIICMKDTIPFQILAVMGLCQNVNLLKRPFTSWLWVVHSASSWNLLKKRARCVPLASNPSRNHKVVVCIAWSISWLGEQDVCFGFVRRAVQTSQCAGRGSLFNLISSMLLIILCCSFSWRNSLRSVSTNATTHLFSRELRKTYCSSCRPLSIRCRRSNPTLQ